MSQLVTNLRVHLSFSLFFLVGGVGGGGGKKGVGGLGYKIRHFLLCFQIVSPI